MVNLVFTSSGSAVSGVVRKSPGFLHILGVPFPGLFEKVQDFYTTTTTIYYYRKNHTKKSIKYGSFQVHLRSSKA